MNLQQVLARLAELEAEVRASQDIEFVKNAQVEKETLLARKVELEELEQRKADILGIQNGSGSILENQKPEQRNMVETMEYRNAWLKNLQGKPLSVEERAMTAASAVVPTYTMNKVVEKLEQTSKLYQFISVSNVPGSLRVPVEDVCEDAEWATAGTAYAPDEDDALTYVDLGMHQLLKTIDLTANVLHMSIEAFENYIVNKLYKKMLAAVEKAVLTGTGTSQPTGLLKSGEITNTLTFTKTAITYADICAIIASLPTGYNPMFTLNRTTYAKEIMGMVDDNGRPIAIVDKNSPTGFSILGYPAILDDNVSVDKIIFGDMSYYQFNWGQDIEITSNASVGFKAGTITYRALAYGDGKKTSASAFALATRATS